MNSRKNRSSLRKSSLEQLEPRKLLAGLGDDAPPLPAGPEGDFIQQYEGLLRSSAMATMWGPHFDGDFNRFPKALPSGATKSVSSAPVRIRETESLDPTVLDVNNIIDDAEPIPLGFGPGQSDAIDVRGSIEQPLVPGAVSSTEDDGSIPLANDSTLTDGGAVTATGIIGDGPHAVDYDFYRIQDVSAGDLITASVTGTAGLDPAVAIYDSVGRVLISNDDTGNGFDSFTSLIAPEDDDYYVLVLGSGFFGFTLPSNPFDPASGVFPDSTGDYEATIGLNYGDIDYYSVALNPGDVLGVDAIGAANQITLFDSAGVELVGNRDGQPPFPTDSPLTADGNATISYIATKSETLYVRVIGDFVGNYQSEFRLFRPGLEQEQPGTKQILFLDFNGASIDTNIFGLPGITQLSPLRDFLPNWGLAQNAEGNVIDAIIDTVRENYRDVGRLGLNGDYRTSGDAGDYGIEIRNSRDHADPYGLPNVSRIIVGGTVLELGIPTVGIAQSVDPGNFATEETGVVLLDILSGPSTDPVSINSFLVNRPTTTKVDLIGEAVGNIVSHEAGHYFGNWHVNRDNDVPDVMDTGGDLRRTIGIGEDGIWGTQDDIDVDFGRDQYAPEEFFTGEEDTLNRIAFGLPTGKGNNAASASGVKWNDLNGNGVRDAGEPGLADFIIYVDVNNDNQFGIGEPAAVTGSNGRYTLRNVPNGTYAVREFVDPGWVQTFPADTGEHILTFNRAVEVTGLNFGNQRGTGENEGRDFGDAPAPYPTRLSDNGPVHGIVPGFHLGGSIDGELNGQPTDLATGDDLADLSDEDGVSFVTDLIPGLETTINVEIQNGVQPAGLLQAWIDFDGDGDWNSPNEQVFSDLAVRAGDNLLTFTVPFTALQGPTVARFRYGYEPGLSYTGSAVAGEVEDYLVDIVRGGPTANDDVSVVRRNSAENLLDVTANDSFRPGTGTFITSVTDAANGTVEIADDGLHLTYTPNFNFDGADSFRYTLRDNTGETDSANVSVTVLPDLAQIRLATTDLDGDVIDSIGLNEQFVLQGLVQDLRDAGTGVFAAYADVTYPAASADVQGPIVYGPDYENGQSGDSSVDGLIDEVGAFDGIDRLGPDETLLFSVIMRATQQGAVLFDVSPADNLPQHNVLLYDTEDPVPTGQIEYRSVEIFVGPGTANPLRTNPVNSLDVNNDTAVSPIDALLVINELNAELTDFQAARAATASDVYLDVSNDGILSPLDALLVINKLNEDAAEGEKADDGLAAVAAAIHVNSSSSMAASSDEEVSHTRSSLLAEASSKNVTLGQQSSLFDSIDELALAEDDVDDMDAVLDLICDDLAKSRV